MRLSKSLKRKTIDPNNTWKLETKNNLEFSKKIFYFISTEIFIKCQLSGLSSRLFWLKVTINACDLSRLLALKLTIFGKSCWEREGSFSRIDHWSMLIQFPSHILCILTKFFFLTPLPQNYQPTPQLDFYFECSSEDVRIEIFLRKEVENFCVQAARFLNDAFSSNFDKNGNKLINGKHFCSIVLLFSVLCVQDWILKK